MSLAKPTPEKQLIFLQDIQRLIGEGDFSATYKFALLMSLAEISVEEVSEVGSALTIPMRKLAEKFAEFYWPQTVPYRSGASNAAPDVLAQNLGPQAAVVSALIELRQQGAATLLEAKRLRNWNSILQRIATVVRQQPVRFLQNVGGQRLAFLYDFPPPRGTLVLKPGVAYMLREFHGLIQQLARASWVKHVRGNRLNAGVIGHADELETFMFGASRNALLKVSQVLSKMQSSRCFYCEHHIHDAAGHVDHFIPWSKYPRDLVHNFVLAHDECNRRKSDMLASKMHLENWLERNARSGEELAGELGGTGFVADEICGVRVAGWAYEQGIRAGAHGWIRARETEPLQVDCLDVLNESTT